MQICDRIRCFHCETCVAKPACRWCEYFMPNSPDVMAHNEMLDGDDDNLGQCRCQPPPLGKISKNENEGYERDPAQWPKIYDFEWCGYFRERLDLMNVSETAVKHAEDFIKQMIKNGPVTNNQMRKNTKGRGIRMNALLIASRNLKIVSRIAVIS